MEAIVHFMTFNNSLPEAADSIKKCIQQYKIQNTETKQYLNRIHNALHKTECISWLYLWITASRPLFSTKFIDTDIVQWTVFKIDWAWRMIPCYFLYRSGSRLWWNWNATIRIRFQWKITQRSRLSIPMRRWGHHGRITNRVLRRQEMERYSSYMY